MIERTFLHNIDLRAGQVSLLWTNARTLRKAAFIDGRSSLSDRQPLQLPLSQFLEDEKAGAPEPRYIFHIGFCGSTLLSRLLDVPGQAFVLREPNCLADIANIKAGLAKKEINHPLLLPAIGATNRHLARPWAAAEPVIVKPSNWVNNILPELISQPGVKALFLTSSRREFLEAVLRGGPARLAFAARATLHLSSEGGEYALVVADALTVDGDQSGRLVRLALVLHAIQLHQFRVIAERSDWGEDKWLDYSHLAADPFDAAIRSTKALDLDIPPGAIANNIALWGERDAKDPGASFFSDRNSRLAVDVHAKHGAVIEQALDWADRFLPY